MRSSRRLGTWDDDGEEIWLKCPECGAEQWVMVDRHEYLDIWWCEGEDNTNENTGGEHKYLISEYIRYDCKSSKELI